MKGNVGEMVLNVDTKASKSFKIKLRSSATEETVLAFDKGSNKFCVIRDKSGEGAGGISEVQLAPSDNLKMQIFLDKSSVEVFLNDGEAVLSNRIYPQESSQDIVFVPEGNLKINKLSFYQLENGLK